MAAAPDLHPAHAAGAAVRGRRRGHDLQGAAARHRCAAAVHGLPLHRARPVARRVPARPLRRADGRRADGAGVRRSMCHDIEDPTFDATAVATNPRAQVRPIHRPPRRRPTDQHPHCAWTVIIDESHPAVSATRAGCSALRSTRAATVALDPIDPADEGAPTTPARCSSDLDFAAFSHSALVRIADEVCLQMHLLDLGFVAPCASAPTTDAGREIATKQLIGIAGHRAPSGSTRARPARRRRGGAAGAGAAPAAQPGGYVDCVGRRTRSTCAVAGPRGRRLDLARAARAEAAAAGGRAGRRPAPRRRGRGHRTDWTARGRARDEPARSSTRSR